MAAAAEKMDASGAAMGKGKGKASTASAVSASASASASASVEAEVEVKDWSQQKRARQAQLGGSVKKVNPSPCDLEACAGAVCDREPWENAMDIMRERRCGWVHSRIVSGRMVILLAQKFRVQAGVVEVLVRRVKAEASEAEKDKAEAEGVWVAAPRGGDEEEELQEGDKGWQVQLVEGGAAGGGKAVSVERGLWEEHRPIIMGSMGDNLLSIEPGTLARALDSGGAAQADVLGVPAADGGGCAGGGCSGCKVCKVGAGCAGDGCSGTGCRACADAAGGAGSSRLFFFAYYIPKLMCERMACGRPKLCTTAYTVDHTFFMYA